MIEKLCEVAMKPDAHGYSQSKGIPGLRRAQAGYYARRFGADLDPESEVVVTMGSKEGLSSLATAIIAPGDVVLAPNPSYPIHTFGFIIAGVLVGHLSHKALGLVFRVVQLGVSVGDLAAADEQLEAVSDARIIVAATGQR